VIFVLGTSMETPDTEYNLNLVNVVILFWVLVLSKSANTGWSCLLNLLYDTFIGIAIRATCCGLLLDELSLSLQPWRKHGEHEDLRGSCRRSVTFYIHEENYCVFFKLVLNWFEWT
jgi:hypothetical protein